MFSRSLYLLLPLLLLSTASNGQNERLRKLIPPEPIGWVSDFEKVFTDGQVKFFDSIIGNFETQTSNQIAIVTLVIDTADIKTLQEFQQVSRGLLNQWGVGVREKNNGIGIIFSKNLRMIRIEVGDGLSSKLTDGESQYIIDNIITPEFKMANYFEGTLKALLEIIKEIN